jgi:bacterioferritin
VKDHTNIGDREEIYVKAQKKLIDTLNDLLADELTAIGQYMVHSEMCEHWGYEALHAAIESQAMDEMHHAEWLIGRILFLEGKPIVSELKAMAIGSSVPEMIRNDQDAELDAVKAYNAGIALASELGDEGTADLLVEILKMEEGHVEWAEKQRALIDQMGLENYLSLQTGGGDGE